MQFAQLPKLSLRFKKIYSNKFLEKRIADLDKIRIDFNSIIPDKISKQTMRLKRSEAKENASNINLRDGSVLKMASLLNKNNGPGFDKPSDSDFDTKKAHSLRKLRIESNIQAELTNFFASSSVPKILRSEYALWSIIKVRNNFL